MAIDRSASSVLRLVPSTAEEACPSQWFCGHCGSPPPNNETPAPPARVCGECGLGLLLEARADVAPKPEDPFVIVDGSLHVCAMSSASEVAAGGRRDGRHQPSDHRAAHAGRRRGERPRVARRRDHARRRRRGRGAPPDGAPRQRLRRAHAAARRRLRSAARRADRPRGLSLRRDRRRPSRPQPVSSRSHALHATCVVQLSLHALHERRRAGSSAPAMSGIRTNAAAVMLGVSPNTLRSWERRFGYPSPGAHVRRPPPVRARRGRGAQAGLRGDAERLLRDLDRAPARRRAAVLEPPRARALALRRGEGEPACWRRASRSARSSARSRRSCCRPSPSCTRRTRAVPSTASPGASRPTGCRRCAASRRPRRAPRAC